MLSKIPDDPETRLGRDDGARALTLAGYPTSPLTLATKASRGNGPLYRLYGRRAIYIWRDLLAWAEANTSMADTVKNTVRSSNGQQVLKTVKNKDLLIPEHELMPFLDALLTEQDGLCAITGLHLQYDRDFDDPEMLCSLDRVDSNGHYEKDNLQIVCRFVNRWKSDGDDMEFRRLIAVLRE